MKIIPAVTETIIVTAEQTIFEPGDMVKIYDLSYLMEMNSYDFDHTGWAVIHGNDYLRKTKKVIVVMTDLKVPVPEYNGCESNRFQKRMDNEIVYLDTMITDGHGAYWLTRSKYLFAK